MRGPSAHVPDVLLPAALYIQLQVRLHHQQALGRAVSSHSESVCVSVLSAHKATALTSAALTSPSGSDTMACFRERAAGGGGAGTTFE